MSKDRKQKLIKLGPEILADALLDLAIHSNTADDLIARLIASPEENIQRFQQKFSSLKHSNRFIDWRDSPGFVRKLEMLLLDLKAGVTDPLTGIKLVASFYEADEEILGSCDDSSGHVSGVFHFNAKELFLDYAACCEDKMKIADIILKLNDRDDYGIRKTLVDCCAECLSEPVIRSMISVLQKKAANEKDEYNRHHHLLLIESLARQIKDAKLFEKTHLDSWGKQSIAAYIDIAEVYLESGDFETAHLWLKKIPEDKTLQVYKLDQLLLEIYRKQGNIEKLTELLYQKFRSHHSTDTLQALLDVCGHDKRDKIISNEVALILKSTVLRESDAQFLISIGKIAEAEQYLINRFEQLDGYNYDILLFLAEAMESKNHNLAASLIYRSLLISILERGYSKAYPHGIRYLKKLDKLAVSISAWNKFNNHQTFKEQIVRAHSRKHSFWSKYRFKNE